jgi:predicted nuclease with TOPRIM domain
MEKKGNLLRSSTFGHIVRALLRTVPIIPAPELYDIIEDLRRSKHNIDEKIKKAFMSLQETSNLIEELQNSLTERTEKLKLLQGEYNRYSKLAEIEEEKAKPLIEQLENSLQKSSKKERLVSLMINLFAGIIVFILGILLGPIIKNILGLN